MVCCKIWETFDVEHNSLKEYKHWKLLVRNRNKTLGNCIVIAKKHYRALSEMNAEELGELSKVAKDIESVLKKAFNYDKINWMMVMMTDDHVHFHIYPRYSETKKFAGMDWMDDGWPKLPGKNKEPVSQDVLQKVRQEIIKYFK